MNYTLEELEKTWNFYDNSAKEIIDNAGDVSFKFIDEDMLKDYDKYIKNNNFLVLFCYKKRTLNLLSFFQRIK